MNPLTPGITARLEELTRQAMTQHALPGLVVAVQPDSEECLAVVQGKSNAAGTEPMDPDTMFGVASLTKLLTAVALLRLEAQGVLSIDDLVERHWPTLRIASKGPMRLVDLLSHSAGLPGLPGRFHARNLADPSDNSGGIGTGSRTLSTFDKAPHAPITSAAELVDLINALDIEPLAPPGHLLNYSNEGYCLLGGVIEAATGKPYADAIQDLVLSPLGMTRTIFGTPGMRDLGNVAVPLVHGDGQWRDVGFWDAPLFYPAGGAVASARDLIRLIRVLDERSTLLGPQGRRRLLQAVMPVASRPGDAARYGLALEHHRIGVGASLAWHSGQRAGISSFFGWVAEERLAVAVLTNVAGAPVAEVGHQVIGQALGRDDACWPPRRAVHDAASGAPAARFTGEYRNAEGFKVVVRAAGDWLVMVREGACEPFRFADHDSGTVGAQTFRFLSDAAGLVWAIALDLRVLPMANPSSPADGSVPGS